jgi:hypothetical protein
MASQALARPKAQPPAPKKPSSTEVARAIQSKVTVRTTKEQEAFEEEATEFAAALGWEGKPEWLLNDIQVSDARRFLTKTFHELHVAALNKDQAAPSAEAVCDHLNITDDEAIGTVEAKLKQVLERETEKPATPSGS